ncbi:hypothetical protein AOQ87_01215 [Candidatus Riesia pediculischaeffi]|uniref:Holo-[acyl-carrier-protein] synthase n=1 Tax=Candidatus Riesia pediculischaeffi TaxID=428411 RepID=A0A1V0HKE6_9ENTR|nr:hypothetical protein AOQ87_01215 [Candidatus Riesia pediculischaeffi]
MSIVGLGVDLINVDRIRKIFLIYRNKFARKILSDKEMKEYENQKDKAGFLAKRFCAKEAISKALGTGFKMGVHFNQLEILHEKTGKPFINLLGDSRSRFKFLGARNAEISITDDREYVCSVVIVEG